MDLMINVVVLLPSMVVVLMEVVLLVSGDRCDGVCWDDSFLNDSISFCWCCLEHDYSVEVDV